MRVAIIDLGSNSVRMNIYVVFNDGDYKLSVTQREMVRLSEGMSGDNLLKPPAMSRTIATLKRYAEIVRKEGCDRVHAVATAAMRDAVNADELLTAVRTETGIELEIIDDATEAFYAFQGVMGSMELENGLILDVGGGSAELVLVNNREMINDASFRLGAVFLTEMFEGLPQSKMYKHAAAQLLGIDWLDEACGGDIVILGGTARAITRNIKRSGEVEELHGVSVSYAEIAQLYQEVFNMPSGDRLKLYGIGHERGDIILGGLVPIKALMDILGSPSARLCTAGVREGIFFSHFDELKNS